MYFEHSFLPYIELEANTTENGRIYNTPDGRFESVTTIIGRSGNKDWLKKWQDRVGKEKADAITTQAGFRGTAIHSLCEKYILNDPEWQKGSMPVNLFNFKTIKSALDDNLELVYGIELPLWSKFLKTAGRCDLVCKYNNSNSIIDFKTSKRIKTLDQIEHYFIQATAYSIMMQERYEIKFPQLVIIMIIDHEEPRIFVENRDKYIEKTIKIFMENNKINVKKKI